MKIAFVYDRVNKFGGAEQVLLALHEIWKDAPLYTSVYHKETAPWAEVFSVIPSFMQYIPFANNHHEWFPWLTPYAFETFDFSAYDVVLSVTSAEAKNVITKPDTLHICYCLTPTRYLWSGYDSYIAEPGLGYMGGIGSKIFRLLTPTLRNWDLIGAQRVDVYAAISKTVEQRIKKYYKRKTETVVYPPVDTDIFVPEKNQHQESMQKFLVVSRLVPYKRIDIVIEACNCLGLPLIIIGDGSDRRRLEKMAGPTITFINRKLTVVELAHYYQQCQAFLFAGEEDFGIVAAEAQSCGKPVICYKQSGMAEIILPGITGEIFEKQQSDNLINILETFSFKEYDPVSCRKQALLFDKEVFKKHMKAFVEEQYTTFKDTNL
jgi:glycosyltransferase involved in cell wall biosynthesis